MAVNRGIRRPKGGITGTGQWSELEGSPTERIDQYGRVRATMNLRVAWRQRYAVMDAFVLGRSPYPHQLQRGSVGAITCIGASSRPFLSPGAALSGETFLRSTNDLADYEYAQVDVEFGVPEIDAPSYYGDPRAGGDLISESLDASLENQILDSSQYVWNADGAPLTEREAPGRLEIGSTYTFRRHQVLAVRSAYFDLQGHVNDSDLVPISPPLRNVTFAKGTLLYVPGGIERSVDLSGNERLTVTMTFIWKPHGWRNFWRGDTLGYDQLRHRGGALYEYPPEGDFLDL